MVKALGRIFLGIIAGLILFLVVGKVYARLSYKESYLTGFTKVDPVFHHIPPPGYSGAMHSDGDFDINFTTNNRGMRGPGDYLYAKDPGTYRIAVMGDSFVFGVGVRAEETMSAELERLLNEQETALGATEPGTAEDALERGRKFQVYNFGVNSYSPVLEYIYLKKEVVKYDPDLVILMLDLCDVQDDYLYEDHIVYASDGAIEGCDPFRFRGGPDIGAILMHRSRLLFTLNEKLLQSIRKMKMLGIVRYITNKSRHIRNKTEILVNKDIDNIEFDRFILNREGKNESVVRRHWDRTAGYILMIKKLLDERNIRFMLVSYPYGFQVGKDEWAIGRKSWAFEEGRAYDATGVFVRIDAFAEDNGIGFISLYGAFLEHEKNGEKLYFNRDGHWTKKGQSVAAEAIFERLKGEVR